MLRFVVGSGVVVVVVVVGVVVDVELLTLLATGAEAAVPVPSPVPVPDPVSYSAESGEVGSVGFRLSGRPTGPRRAASAMSGQLSSSG